MPTFQQEDCLIFFLLLLLLVFFFFFKLRKLEFANLLLVTALVFEVEKHFERHPRGERLLLRLCRLGFSVGTTHNVMLVTPPATSASLSQKSSASVYRGHTPHASPGRTSAMRMEENRLMALLSKMGFPQILWVVADS